MRILIFAMLALTMAGTPAVAHADTEIQALRAELERIRSDYEARIADLERRLDAAEKQAATPQPAPAPEPSND